MSNPTSKNKTSTQNTGPVYYSFGSYIKKEKEVELLAAPERR